MRVFIMSKGWVRLVARRPAIAPEGILIKGPEEGELSGDAGLSPISFKAHSKRQSHEKQGRPGG